MPAVFRIPYRLTPLAAALSLTALLAACGGGGGGGAPTASASNPQNTPTASASAPQAAFNAAVIGQQAADRLYAIQKAAGWVMPPNFETGQSAALQAAAQHHANYLVANKAYTFADDNGANSTLQAMAQGYPYIATQAFGILPPGVDGAQWMDAVMSSGGAPLLIDSSQWGAAIAPVPGKPYALMSFYVGNLAVSNYVTDAKGLAVASKQNMTWPYNGETNVPPTNQIDVFWRTSAWSTPVKAGTVGPLISVFNGLGSTVMVDPNSVKLTSAQGQSVPVTVYNMGDYFNTAYIVPNAPLQPNTQYQLTFQSGYIWYASAFYPQTNVFPETGTSQILFGPFTTNLTFTTGSQTAFNPGNPFN